MVSVGILRQIVSDIHAVSPQGLRKAVRTELAATISKPSSLIENEKARTAFSKSCIKDFFTSSSERRKLDKLELAYPKRATSNYFAKVYKKEQASVTKKTLKELQVKIQNRDCGTNEIEKNFNVTQGVLALKKAGLKLPENVCLEDLRGKGGYFTLKMPTYIFVDCKEERLCRIAIHESVHLNDTVAQKLFQNDFTRYFAALGEKLMPFWAKKQSKVNYAIMRRPTGANSLPVLQKNSYTNKKTGQI